MATRLPRDPRPPMTATGRGRDDIYVSATPLRATKGPAQLLMSAAYSLNLWDLHHFMLIIKPSITSASLSPLSKSQVIVFDFQPQDPENIYVALNALYGKAIPGTILVRNISNLPKRKCLYIGSSKLSNAVEAAYEFNSTWGTGLRIGLHDCRHYTNGLAETLTGEKDVVERFKRETTRKIQLDDANKKAYTSTLW